MPGVTPDQFANWTLTAVAGGASGIGSSLNSTDTIVYLQAGFLAAHYPASYPFMVLLGSSGSEATGELVKATGSPGTDQLTIVRGNNLPAPDTCIAQTWPVGTAAQASLSAGNMAHLWSEVQYLAYNVKSSDFGAKVDGVTGDGAAINAAMTAANAAGGGVVYCPAGTSIIDQTIVMYPNVQLRGDGPEASIWQAKNSLNADMMQTQNFASLTGTNNDAAGVSGWSMQGISLRGNNANNTSGRGISIYGYNYWMRDVVVLSCASDGIYSEWATPANVVPVGDSLEATLDHVKSGDNLGNGIVWAGPHDSIFDTVIAFQNGTSGDGHSGIYVKSNASMLGGPLQIMNSHSWGNSQSWALKSESQVILSNNQWEGAQSSQVLLSGSGASYTAADSSMHGDIIFAAGTITNPVGLEIGATSVAPTGLDIYCKIINCTTAAVKFTDDGGNSRLLILNYQTSGSSWTGTLAVTTNFSIQNPNAGVSQSTVVGHLLALTQGTPTLGSLQTNISSQSISGNDIRGTVTITTGGTAPVSGATVAIVNFGDAYAAVPFVFVQGLGGLFYWSTSAVGSFKIVANATLGTSATYYINYFVIG